MIVDKRDYLILLFLTPLIGNISIPAANEK